MDETVTMSRENYDAMQKNFRDRIKSADDRANELHRLHTVRLEYGRHYHEAIGFAAARIVNDQWRKCDADRVKAYMDTRAVEAMLHEKLVDVLIAGANVLGGK